MAETDTIGGYVDRIGFGRFQTKLLFVCGAGWLADAWEVVLVAFVLPGIVSEWSLSGGEASLVASSIFIGMLLGAWFWGSVSDYVGRRFGFQATVLIDSVFGLLSALSPNFLVLALLRGLTGFGVGGTLPVDYSIFAEYLPTRKRGRYLVYLESFWALGTVVAAGIAFLVTGAFGATPGWRYLLAISAAPGIVIFLVRRYIPESPRYLVLQGRRSEAREVLRRVAAENQVEVEVGEIMTHRKKVSMIDLGDKPDEIVDQMLDSQFTRIPVYRDDQDNVVGIMHTKELLRELRRHKGDVAKIDFDELPAEPWFIPDTTSLLDQLQAYRERREHFAVVVDEYGSLMGIVTLEDILEEIVGEIEDEHDTPVSGVRPQPDGGYIVDGTVTIRDLNREFDWNLPDEEAATIAGLVMYESRLIPDKGQTFTFHGFRFEVLRRVRNQLTSLRVTPPGAIAAAEREKAE